MVKNLPNIENIASIKPPSVSFEFYPPKSEDLEEKLINTIKELAPLEPKFISVTYGAGGSTRERTRHALSRVLQETKLNPAAHLTCVGSDRGEIDEIARDYWNTGIKHIVALRGDAPKGQEKYIPHPGGYAYATDLVKGLKKIGDFEISVAAYPETHPEAQSPEADIRHLKEKVDAGATRAITQYFFNTDLYLKFRDKCVKEGISAPVVPGVMPIVNYEQMVRFSNNCGATVPKWVAHLLEPLNEKPELHKTIASMIAAEQCRILINEGVEHIHFYTLNNADYMKAICHTINIRG